MCIVYWRGNYYRRKKWFSISQMRCAEPFFIYLFTCTCIKLTIVYIEISREGRNDGACKKYIQ